VKERRLVYKREEERKERRIREGKEREKD